MHILTTLSPVFVMILLGYLLRRRDFLSEETVRQLSRLVYWVGLPCLLFYKISISAFNLADCGRIFAVMMISMIGCIFLAYGLAMLFRVRARSISAVVQGAFRGNLAFIGLPVLVYSFSGATADAAGTVQVTAVFVLALMVLANNVAAVPLFLLHQHKMNRQVIRKIVFGILTNPLLVSSAAGLAVGFFVKTLPVAADRTLSAFSQMVLPLALISVGASIADQKITHTLFPAVLASVIKVAVCPLIGFLAARHWISLGPEHLRLAMIFMACPTAAASYVLADQLGGDQQLTAAIVVLSSVLSVVSISIVVGLF